MRRWTTRIGLMVIAAALAASTCLMAIPDLEEGPVGGSAAAAGSAPDAGGGAAAGQGGTGAGGVGAGGSGGAPLTYRDVVLQDFPIAYWRLGDPLGATTAVDEVSPGTPGTYENVQLQVAGAIAGDADSAARFGENSSLDMGEVFGFIGRSAFTLEGWFRPTNIDAEYRRLLSKEQTDIEVGYSLFVRDLDLHIYRKADGGVDAVWLDLPDPRIGAAAYAHIVATYDGNEMCLYVNASQVGSCRASTSEMPVNSGHFGVGLVWAGFTGDADEIAVYDHALTATRVGAHYQSGAP